MKSRSFVLYGVLASFVLAAFAVSTFLFQSTEQTYEPRAAYYAEGYSGAYEIYTKLKSNVETGKVEPQDAVDVREEVKSFGQRKSAVGFTWSEMGPDDVGGRCRAIVVNPDNPNIVYAGSVSGGLFKSTNGGNTWSKVSGFNDNLIIGSMAMLGNGQLYVGTGSRFEGNPSGGGGSDFVGNGLYFSTDGETFQHAQDDDGEELKPSTPSPGLDWTQVNELVADPVDGNGLWIAYNDGLRYYNSSSKTLTEPDGLPGGIADDVAISADGQMLLAQVGNRSYRSTDGGDSFTQISGSGDGQLPQGGVGRLEFAISQDDKDFAYALLANNSSLLHGLYSSTDGGVTWSEIWPGGVDDFDPFETGAGGQGVYDNVVTVVPGQPGVAIVGGVTLWRAGVSAQPEQIAINFGNIGDDNYVHSDIHEFTWGPNNEFYIGTDGGVFKSTDLAQTFTSSNKGFNVTQFYCIDYSRNDRALGGTQDNGSIYLTKPAGAPMAGTQVLGGDGFDCDISYLDPNVLFGSLYFGTIQRSDNGGPFSLFYDNVILDEATATPLGTGLGGFFTALRLFEDDNDLDSQDSILYINTDTAIIEAGETITYASEIQGIELTHELEDALNPGDSILLQDRLQSIFAGGFTGSQGVWITRGAMRFSSVPEWYKVLELAGNEQTKCLEFSKDGNHLFVGTWSGRLYRISGLDSAYSYTDAHLDSGATKITSEQIYNGGGVVTGINVDANDPDHVVITRGGYGGSDKVLESFNATTAATFTSIQGDLPIMPVYDVIIDREDPEIIVVGTEYGVYATDDGGETWADENANGMDRTPVFTVRQQWRNWTHGVANPGVIYLGTHGRGIFKSETLLSAKDPSYLSDQTHKAGLQIFPNPLIEQGTIEIDLDGPQTTIEVSIFDLQGKLVEQVIENNLQSGTQQIQFDANRLEEGTYIVLVRTNKTVKSGKFVKVR